MSDEPTPPLIIGEKSPDFKIVFVDGGFTWLGRETGTITFFYDVFADKMLNDKGGMDFSTLKRIFPMEIRMRRSAYVTLIQFMTEQLNILENLEKEESTKKSK